MAMRNEANSELPFKYVIIHCYFPLKAGTDSGLIHGWRGGED
jgi:hypothetical protein